MQQCANVLRRDDQPLRKFSRLLEIQQDRKSRRKLCPGATNLVVLTSFAKIVYTKKKHAGGMKTILLESKIFLYRVNRKVRQTDWMLYTEIVRYFNSTKIFTSSVLN